jgi:hypothetical protein
MVVLLLLLLLLLLGLDGACAGGSSKADKILDGVEQSV